MNEVELALAEVDLVIARRLKTAVPPSEERPKKVPCVWDHVDFMEWETWEDLGLDPPAGEQWWYDLADRIDD